MAREERWDTWRLQRTGVEKPREGQEKIKRTAVGLVVPGTVFFYIVPHSGAEQRLCVGKCAEAASHLSPEVTCVSHLAFAMSPLSNRHQSTPPTPQGSVLYLPQHRKLQYKK